MRRVLPFLSLLIVSELAASERVSINQTDDQQTNQLFNRLGQDRNAARKPEGLTATANALNALLKLMSSSIKSLRNYTGIFTGNCSVFFEDAIQSAACDIAPTDSRSITLGSELTEDKSLPQAYWHQITLSHILLASVFGDWRRGKLQEFKTDLYFKQSTCSDSMTLSETIQTESRFLTDTVSLSDTKSFSLSPSGSLSGSLCPNIPRMWLALSFADGTNQTSRYYIQGSGINATVLDTFTGLTWEQTPSVDTFTWNASAPAGSAQAYCSALTKDGCLDWRLPNPQELQSLVDYTTASPAINRTIFPGTSSTHFWTSAVTPRGSWFTSFGIGDANSETASVANRVRCVRGSNVILPTRYTDRNGNALTAQSAQVKDQVTGLIWQRVRTTIGMSWESAENYCQNLVVENQGAGSWRLPTVKELSSLVDYTVPNPGINATAFPGFGGGNSQTWTATVGWYVYFGYGSMYVTVASLNSAYGVRCVYCSDCPPSSNWSLLAYQDITNQTGRYNVAGSPPNAIVTDDFTGLMWEQQVSGSTYLWNASAPGGSAQAYCGNLTKGGYADWRLPSIFELQSLVDYYFPFSPVINAAAFPATPNSYFWTDTLGASGILNRVWDVRFSYSGIILPDGGIGSGLYYVRCVRGLRNVPVHRYTDENGNTLTNVSAQVRDQATGLIWQRILASFQMPWNATAPAGSAQAYCQNLVVDNQTAGSWRLPTVKELTSLANHTLSFPSIDTIAFPATPSGAFWPSSPLVGTGSATAWNVWFDYGSVNNWFHNIAANLSVRCVR